MKAGPEYADVQAQLLALVNIEGFHKNNDFCVVGQRGYDYDDAIVYWPTQHMLSYWEAKPDDPDAIADARSSLNLDRDVVATEDEVGTSTYLVTRAYINQVVNECNEYGEHYSIVKSDSGWKPVSAFPQFATLQTQLKELLTPPPWLAAADLAACPRGILHCPAWAGPGTMPQGDFERALNDCFFNACRLPPHGGAGFDLTRSPPHALALVCRHVFAGMGLPA